MHTYMHACMHTYIHTYIRTSGRTCARTGVPGKASCDTTRGQAELSEPDTTDEKTQQNTAKQKTQQKKGTVVNEDAVVLTGREQ